MAKLKDSTEDFETVKNLLILLLLKLGASQKEIAKALKVDQGNFSREFPARAFKKFDFLSAKE